MAEFGRFPHMGKTKAVPPRGGDKGSFGDRREELLSRFPESDTSGERRWRETFGYERRPEKPKGGKPFIAREARRSSSDS